MDQERWQRIQALFDSAIEISRDDRDSFLREQCGRDGDLLEEVRSLLVSREESAGFLDQGAVEFAAPAISKGDDFGGPADPGDCIGPYRIIRRIAHGGMSVVYRAEREEPYHLTVAIKVLDHSANERLGGKRFDAERQILAALNHPNIARILDGGVTAAGHPYLVMEYVDGLSITDYCQRGGLSLAERLELFDAICSAVQHAHRQFVVHRDLKPGNILVREDGTVKLLDFGIAKLIDPEAIGGMVDAPATRTGLWLLTPEYAAPEQVLGDTITTATDVFSLGAVLFELLTGFKPRNLHSKSPTEVVQMVSEGVFPKVSAATRSGNGGQLAGDLDTIVAKATRLEPGRRYTSPSELADDLRRYREGLPISARSASPTYRAGKFVRRHRIALIASSAVVAFGLFHLTEVTKERNRAQLEAETAGQVSDFLVELFAESDPNESRGRTITAREVLARGASRIDKELEGQPLVQARLFAVMGNVYRKLGLYEEARPFLERSLDTRLEHLEEGHLDIAAGRTNMGYLLTDLGDYEEATRMHEQALAGRKLALGSDHPDVANSLNSIAELRSMAGDGEEARRLFERALSIYEESYGAESPEVSGVLNNLANIVFTLGDHEESLRLSQRALAISEKGYGPDHPTTASCLLNLGVTLMELGRQEESFPYFERSLEIRTKALGPDHPEVAQGLDNLAVHYYQAGMIDEATERWERALEIREKSLGPDHPDVAFSMNNLGEGLKSGGDLVRSRELFERALEIWEETFGPENLYVGGALHNLACLDRDTGNTARAERRFERTQEIWEAALGPDDPYVAENLNQHARLLRNIGRESDAERLEARASEILSH